MSYSPSSTASPRAQLVLLACSASLESACHDNRSKMTIASASQLRLRFLQLLVAVVIVGCWHIATTTTLFGAVKDVQFFFSTPADVAVRIVKWFTEGTIWRHLWITLIEAVLAFVIGTLAGV